MNNEVEYTATGYFGACADCYKKKYCKKECRKSKEARDRILGVAVRNVFANALKKGGKR